MLVAVNASALRADRICDQTRLRALTAPPRRSRTSPYVMAYTMNAAAPRTVEFDDHFESSYPAIISPVLVSTSFAIDTLDAKRS